MTSSITMQVDLLAIRQAGSWLHGVLAASLPADEADAIASRLELAVHEVCVNVVDHSGLDSGAQMTLEAEIDAAEVRIRLTDGGARFEIDNVAVPQPGVPQERGYGLLIVRKLVDALGYDRVSQLNHLTLTVNRFPSGRG